MANKIYKEKKMYTPTYLVQNIQYLGLPIDRALIFRMEKAGAIGTPANNASIEIGRRPIYSDDAYVEILTYVLLANIYKAVVGLESRVPGKLEMVGEARRQALEYESTDGFYNRIDSNLVADYNVFLPVVDLTEGKNAEELRELKKRKNQRNISLAYFFARQVIQQNFSKCLLSNLKALYSALGTDLRTSNYFYEQDKALVNPLDSDTFLDKAEDLQQLFQKGASFLSSLMELSKMQRDEVFAWFYLAREVDIDKGGFFTAGYVRPVLNDLGIDLSGTNNYTLRLLAEITMFNIQKDKWKITNN